MKKIISILLIIGTVVFSTGSLLLSPNVAMAATISAASDTMSNETVSSYSSHLIKFRSPSGVTATTNTITITWPSDFDLTGSVIGDVTSFKEGPVTGIETTLAMAASATTSTWGVAFNTGPRTLTFTAPTTGTGYITANDFVTITIVNNSHLKNPTTSGSKSISIATVSGTSDSGTIAVPIIASNTVTLDATVAPTLTFSNDNAALHFGTLSAAAATYANATTGSASDSANANTFTISTNAVTGYTLSYAAASTLTLVGGSATIAAATVTNSATGTPGTAGGQFAMSTVYSGAGGNVTSTYNHNTGSGNWKFNTAGETLITNTSPASAETVGMRYLANISNVTPAGVYATTTVWTATANF